MTPTLLAQAQKNIDHDLRHNITLDEIMEDGTPEEWVGDYIEEAIGCDSDDDDYDSLCFMVYDFFGVGESTDVYGDLKAKLEEED